MCVTKSQEIKDYLLILQKCLVSKWPFSQWSILELLGINQSKKCFTQIKFPTFLLFITWQPFTNVISHCIGSLASFFWKEHICDDIDRFVICVLLTTLKNHVHSFPRSEEKRLMEYQPFYLNNHTWQNILSENQGTMSGTH